MYTLEVPPFVEVTVATTDEEMELLRRQYAFVKPPLGGTSRSNLDDVLKQWTQQVVLADMRDPSLELRRLDGAGPLSTSTVTQGAEGIIDNFDGVTHQDDVFYLVYPRTISCRAAGIRNILQVAEGPEITGTGNQRSALPSEETIYVLVADPRPLNTQSREAGVLPVGLFPRRRRAQRVASTETQPNASDPDLVRVAGRTGTPR